MNVLLSIKPAYVRKIVSGDKKYELRKRIFKTAGINRIYIYSSSPEKKIIGSFAIGAILKDTPLQLWEKLQTDLGIDYPSYCDYFQGKVLAYAIRITDLEIFPEPIDPKDVDPGFNPPQSFRYIPKNFSTSDRIIEIPYRIPQITDYLC